MSPSTSVSEATQEQQTFEEAFIAVYVAARTDGTFSTPADGLQYVVDAERKVSEMEASAAPVAASKGTQRVHWIGEAQSDEEQRASQIRSRISTGDTPEDLSQPASIDAPRKRQKRGVKGVGNDGKGGTSGLEVAARKSTHEGAQEVVAEQGASARAIESCEPFPAIKERIPEKVQRPFPRPSKEQIDAIIEETFSAHGRHNGTTVGCGSPIYQP